MLACCAAACMLAVGIVVGVVAVQAVDEMLLGQSAD
jgi:hypothetical protein